MLPVLNLKFSSKVPIILPCRRIGVNKTFFINIADLINLVTLTNLLSDSTISLQFSLKRDPAISIMV